MGLKIANVIVHTTSNDDTATSSTDDLKNSGFSGRVSSVGTQLLPPIAPIDDFHISVPYLNMEGESTSQNHAERPKSGSLHTNETGISEKDVGQEMETPEHLKDKYYKTFGKTKDGVDEDSVQSDLTGDKKPHWDTATYDDEQRSQADVQHDNSINSHTDWTAIRRISDDSLCQILLATLDNTQTLDSASAHVLGRHESTYTMTILIALHRIDKTEQYLIRIPANGTKALWKGSDRCLLEAQVHMLKHIRVNVAEVPVPEIFGYSATVENALGTPYVVMEKLAGDCAGDVSFDDPDNEDRWLGVDSSSDEIQRKRVDFLKSLARFMVPLGTLTLDKIGTMPYNHWNGSDQTYMESGLEEWVNAKKKHISGSVESWKWSSRL